MPYYMTASVMGFGIRSSFLFTLLACLWLLPEEHYLFRSPLFWMGSVVCIGGVAALFQGSLKEADASAPGLLIMLGSAGVWGFYGVTVRKYLRGFTPQRCFAVISLYTAAILIALMLIFGRVASLRLLSPIQLGLLLISAVIGVAFAHILMFYVLSHLGPVIESGAEMLTPFFTFCGAALIFGEHMSLIQWCGGVGVVAGCLLMICVSKPKDAVESGIE
jgi:drug/metabolite transporter (DMT)-like permease